MILRLLLPCLCLLVAGGIRAETSERWYSVRLDQRHIGYMLSSREQMDLRVVSRSELRIQLQRNGEPLLVRSEETSVESNDGRPLAFSSMFETSGTYSRVRGTIDADGRIVADVERAGSVDQIRMPWPESALLAEGQRRHLLAFISGSGEHTEFLAFDPTSLQALAVRSARLDDPTAVLADLDPGAQDQRPVVAIRQRMGRDGSSIESRILLDQQTAEPLAMRLPALGLQLEFIACDRACAQAAPEAADVLVGATVDSPRPLSPDERLRALRFHLDLDGLPGEALSQVPGQHLSGAIERPRLLIDPEGSSLSPPEADDLRPTRWLQSDDPDLRALAQATTEGHRRDSVRMLLLERQVREHIRTKSLRIGYASAREAFDLAEGDCTEHAVLLAALARAANIPARVVTGLAYSPRFGERRHVFVPHAWVMAWIDGRWRGYDAAMPRFDAAHIGLATGHGDPFDFYAGLDLLGKLKISAIKPASRRELRQARSAR